MPNRKTGERGFTLIELLVTLAVAAILVTIAVPNFQSFVRNNRLAAQANELIGALSLARSEAVKRGANVEVCVSSNSTSCGTGSWAQGWVVRHAAGVIRSHGVLTGGSSLSAGTDVGTKITFTPSGRTTISTTATDASTTLTLCAPGSSKGRAIQVERTGRARVAEATCP